MHHVLWEPRLGAERFFELYAETWRRSILNTSGEKTWLEWMRQVKPAQIPYLTRVLMRTQRMMKAPGVLEGARRGAAHRPRSAAPRRRPWSPPDTDRARRSFPGGRAPLPPRIRIRATPRARLAGDPRAGPRSLADCEGRFCSFAAMAGRRSARARGRSPRGSSRFGFTKLDEIPEREIVFGIGGKFWRHDGGSAPARRPAGVPRFRRGRLRQGGVEPADRRGARRGLRALDRDAHPISAQPPAASSASTGPSSVRSPGSSAKRCCAASKPE